MGIRVTTSCK